MIIIAGKATLKPGAWEQARTRAQAMVEVSEQEPGCISYRIYTDPSDPTLFFVFEEWESQEALEGHFKTEHYRDFGPYLASLLAAPPAIKRYEVASVGPL